MVLATSGLDHLAPQAPHGRQRAGLVGLDQSGVADDVGGQDRREPPLLARSHREPVSVAKRCASDCPASGRMARLTARVSRRRRRSSRGTSPRSSQPTGFAERASIVVSGNVAKRGIQQRHGPVAGIPPRSAIVLGIDQKGDATHRRCASRHRRPAKSRSWPPRPWLVLTGQRRAVLGGRPAPRGAPARGGPVLECTRRRSTRD